MASARKSPQKELKQQLTVHLSWGFPELRYAI
jgi:hypothetical protein